MRENDNVIYNKYKTRHLFNFFNKLLLWFISKLTENMGYLKLTEYKNGKLVSKK